jgi:RNA-directed DNA polymerase
MKFLRQRIKDRNFLRLIGRFLKAGVMEEGKLIDSEKGTPQGAVLSPVLANIYLHFVLDLWFEKVIKREIRGFVQLIRYADDFIVLFQIAKEAKEFGRKLRERLTKFGLKIAEEKSKIIWFGQYAWQKAQIERKRLDTFDFLGFTHYCDKTRGGKFKLGRKTASKKFRQKVKQMNQWLKSIRNQIELRKWWRLLGIKLIGHYRYYGISGNMPLMRAYYTRTLRLAHKWINRRSQKKSYNWQQFLKFVKYNPLPLPKICHLTYTLSL